MRMKKMLKRAGSFAMALAVMTGAAAAALPVFVTNSSITASAATYGDYEYEIKNGGAEITKYKGNGGKVTIPSKLGGYTVNSIGVCAFSDCTGLTSITIPNSVTSIGNCAFSDCTGLTSITIPNSVTSIGDLAFFECTGLTSITIPNSVTSIGEGAFAETAWYDAKPQGLVYAGKVAYTYKGEMPFGTKIVLKDGTKGIASNAFSCREEELTSITIPNSVTSIGHDAFYKCMGLTSITIPNSVTSIGDGAFYFCTGLTSINVDSANKYFTSKNGVLYNKDMSTIVCCPGAKTSITIPNSVTSIGYVAFSGCTGLTNITIPNGVKSIGDWAFSGCDGLTSITIPNSVTSIGDGAFYGCKGLTSVTIPNSVTSIGYWDLGYYDDSENHLLKKIDGFTIYGTKGSAAEEYANENGFKFVAQSTDIAVTGITLSKTSLTLDKGKTATLTATVTPSNATNKTITWTSSNTSVATVSNGTITAKGAGTATITAKTSNGKTATCKVTVQIGVTKITLNKTAVTLKKGETVKIKATVSHSNAVNKNVTWTSSNTNVATVSGGTVTAKATGTTTITAKTANGTSATCTVRVVADNYIVVTGMIMNKSNITLGQNEAYQLNAGIYPPNASDKSVTWTTSDSSIVTVTTDGKITGKKNGTAVIMARSIDGKKTTCNVTVKNAPTKVSVSKTEMTLKVGQKGSLDYILPADCGCGKCVFRSSDSSVVKMQKTLDSATFKAVKKGTAYVIAKTYNGKEAKCKITVV